MASPPSESDPELELGRQLLSGDVVESSASRIVSTWLPESTPSSAAGWSTGPTSAPEAVTIPPSPPTMTETMTSQTTAWQGVEAADMAPRLPADSVVAPAPIQPSIAAPPSAVLAPTYESAPVIVRQAPACEPVVAPVAVTPYVPAPVATLPGARPGMSVRRGLVGQPVIHMPGQPVRNFLRFVTP